MFTSKPPTSVKTEYMKLYRNQYVRSLTLPSGTWNCCCCYFCFSCNWPNFSQITPGWGLVTWRCRRRRTIMYCRWDISTGPIPSVLGLEGHRSCKKSGVGLLVVTIWLELCVVLAPNVTTTSITFSSNKTQNGDILVPAKPGPPGKMSVKSEGEWDRKSH